METSSLDDLNLSSAPLRLKSALVFAPFGGTTLTSASSPSGLDTGGHASAGGTGSDEGMALEDAAPDELFAGASCAELAAGDASATAGLASSMRRSFNLVACRHLPGSNVCSSILALPYLHL